MPGYSQDERQRAMEIGLVVESIQNLMLADGWKLISVPSTDDALGVVVTKPAPRETNWLVTIELRRVSNKWLTGED